MQEEMRRYKAELMCPLCKVGKGSGFDGKVRPKECILARCQHIFCRECIDERINVGR